MLHRGRTAHLIALLALGLLVSGCRRETRLLLTIDGDYAVPDEVDHLFVVVRSDDATFQTAHALARITSRVDETLSITEGRRIRDAVQIRVEARKGNSFVAAGEGAARFERDETVPVTIFLDEVGDDDGGEAPEDEPAEGEPGLEDAGVLDAGLLGRLSEPHPRPGREGVT